MPIYETDNAGTIHDRMKVLGADVLIRTLELFLDGEPQSKAQSDIDIEPTPAPKLNRENTEIDFNHSSVDVFNFVRGLSPYPSAWCRLKVFDEEYIFKIFDTAIITSEDKTIQLQEAGETYISDKNRLFVKTADGMIEILELQASGKKRMKTKDFLNGLRF